MPNFLASWQPSERRDAGAAERTGLENRSGGNSTGGSNPPLSAKIQSLTHHQVSDKNHTWNYLEYFVGIFWGKGTSSVGEIFTFLS